MAKQPEFHKHLPLEEWFRNQPATSEQIELLDWAWVLPNLGGIGRDRPDLVTAILSERGDGRGQDSGGHERAETDDGEKT